MAVRLLSKRLDEEIFARRRGACLQAMCGGVQRWFEHPKLVNGHFDAR